MGVNSTTYNATAAGYPINSLSLPNTTFIESTNGDIAIGSWGANAVHFVVNGTTATQDALTISSAGNVTTPNVLTGAEVVASNGLMVNSNTVSASYSIPSGSSATSAGPMTVASGVSVTISSGSRWVVVNGTTATQDALTISSAGNVTTPNVLTGAEVVASNGLMVNSNTVSASYSIPSGSSATSAGPMTVASGVSVTISSGSRWVVL